MPEWMDADKASATTQETVMEAVSQSSANTTSTCSSCSTTTTTSSSSGSTNTATSPNKSTNTRSEEDIYTQLEEITDQMVACQATKNMLQTRLLLLLGVNVPKNALWAVADVAVSQELVSIQQLSNHNKGHNDKIINNNNNNKMLSWTEEERNSMQEELDAVELEITSHATKLLKLHEELLDLEEK
jgi:hypothetical protein